MSRLGLLRALRRTIDDELAHAFEEICWQIEPDAERTAERLPVLAAEVAVYAAREAVRNAARHGRNGNDDRPLHLKIDTTSRDGLEIAVEDDGVGPGVAGAEAGGSGNGLELHSTMMAVVGGTLAIDAAPRGGTRVVLSLPRSLAAAGRAS